MKKVRKTCAFTGHRPKKLPWGYNETDVRCVALKVALERQIRSLVQEGVTDFLSGMAEGIDLLAAEIVLNLRAEYPCIKLHCILPYKGQETEWSAASQARYHAILAQADSIIYVSRIFRKMCIRDRWVTVPLGTLEGRTLRFSVSCSSGLSSGQKGRVWASRYSGLSMVITSVEWPDGEGYSHYT